MKKQYSQNDEERVILEYFGDRKGTFLSIGENDGVTFSNVRALAERGWNGVCIEPSPKAFERLKRLYTGNNLVMLFEVAIGDCPYDGKVILKESGPLVSKNDTSLVSTIIPSETKRFENSVEYKDVVVSCKTWMEFSESLPYRAHDVISIDAEGTDLVILQQLKDSGDLAFASLVCIEWNGDKGLAREYDSILMLDQGMHLIYTSAENLIYAR